MINYKLIISAVTAFLLSTAISYAQEARSYKLSSPDKTNQVEFRIVNNGNLSYKLNHKKTTVLNWSDLGLQTSQSAAEAVITGYSKAKHSEKFKWVFGENEHVENKYNEISLICSSGLFKFTLLVRVFNGSLAFKYLVPEQAGTKDLTINKELTSFNFTGPYKIYQYHHESVFTPLQIDSLNTTCDFPATLTNGKLFISVGEAQNENYTKAELGKGMVANSLEVVFARDKEVKFTGAFETPWRTVSISNTAIGLHKFNDLFLRLSPPPKAEIPQSIQPGKLIRAQLTTQDGLDCIDLAKNMNFKYIMFDAGWYGPERAVTSDPRVPIDKINMPEVIRYGKENGVGVILYVNYTGLQNHLDSILPLYKK